MSGDFGKEIKKNINDVKGKVNSMCAESDFSQFSQRLLDLATKGRNKSKVLKYFMHSTDTWVILLNVMKSHYDNQKISISDCLKGTYFTKESGLSFIKKTSDGENTYFSIVDDFIDNRKKVVKVSDKVINEFEYYCNKISICVDDPVNKDSCHKII